MKLQLSDTAYTFIKERWEGLRDKEAKAMGFSVGAWIPPGSALDGAIAIGKVGTDLANAATGFSESSNAIWDIVLAAYALDQIPEQDRYVLYGIPFYLPEELKSIFVNAVLNCHEGKLEIVKPEASTTDANPCSPAPQK